MQGGLKGGIPTFSCGVLRARRPAEGVQPLADKKDASYVQKNACKDSSKDVLHRLHTLEYLYQ
jgi:hypothetical protein